MDFLTIWAPLQKTYFCIPTFKKTAFLQGKFYFFEIGHSWYKNRGPCIFKLCKYAKKVKHKIETHESLPYFSLKTCLFLFNFFGSILSQGVVYIFSIAYNSFLYPMLPNSSKKVFPFRRATF
jgi:hypothetical protein